MSKSGSNSELVALHQLLEEVDLAQFALKIIEELQVSRISHFEFVTTEDLMGIGMGKPAARRLLDAVKKRKGTLKKKFIQTFQTSNKDFKQFQTGKIFESTNHSAEQSTQNNITCLIKESELKIGIQLGDGSFGVVYKGEWNRSNSTSLPVAVKILKEDVIQQQGVYDDFVREVEAMQSVQHECLIRLHGVVLSQRLMMVTELAPLGSLLDYLHKQCSCISICDLWQFASQVSSGMSFLESRRLLHRDLACRNIFMTSKVQVKLGDFGLLCSLPADSDRYIMTEQRRVPFPWCAPESLKSREFSRATDVWMFGVALWEMFTFGDEPWVGLTGHEILNKIDKKGERLVDPQAAPEVICKIMHRCWSANPAERPRFSEITDELSSNIPATVRCRVDGTQETQWDIPAGAQKLDLQEGDSIVVIDGRPDFYWWTGQNQRTFQIGIFPRCWTEPTRKRTGEDISHPLRHSFIHTGHGSAVGPSWGSPAAIDEVYLRNPMEPVDILGLKDPAVLTEPPRKPLEIIKSKKQQFEYSRLKEDDVATGRSSPATAPSTAKNSPTVHEDLLLIDLSPDQLAVPEVPVSRPIYDQPAEVQPEPVSDLDRIYANYPVGPSASAFNGATAIVSSNSTGRYESHYYSQVPVEPISPVPALLPCAPPSVPVSPIKPFVSEEMKKKRDEAFDWLGQALGELSVTKSAESKQQHNDNQCNLQHLIADKNQVHTRSHYGFDDDFSVVALEAAPKPRAAVAATASSLENSAFFRHQQQQQQPSHHVRPMDGIRKPYYPKPGIWTMEDGQQKQQQQQAEVTSPLPFSSATLQRSNGGVQTAHVRPFVIAAAAAAAPAHSDSGPSTSLAVNQIRASAPWASEAEIKQALAIHSNKPLDAVRFLQVEKLYRLGLCSKGLCAKALEASNWDLEKAASRLLDS